MRVGCSVCGQRKELTGVARDRGELWPREFLKSHLLGPEVSSGRAENSLILGATEGDRVEWILWLACSKPGFAISPHG